MTSRKHMINYFKWFVALPEKRFKIPAETILDDILKGRGQARLRSSY
jgi:hypothetical protein